MKKHFSNQWKKFETFSFLPEITWWKNWGSIDIAWLWWRIVIKY